MNEAFYLSDEQRMIRDLARKIARERVAPNAARYDEAEAYPEDSIRALIESGLYGIWVPEAYGGNAMGALALALVCEEIAAACAATGTQYLDQPLGGIPILLAGTDEQKKRLLPRLATGEILCAYSLSEPAAGSDAAGLKTTAVRKGDHYVLNGSKQWCTNGDHADVITVFATLDPSKRARGVTAFLVEKGTPGFSVGKKERKMGIRASPTVALHFSDCAVPAANRLGARARASSSPCARWTSRARPPARSGSALPRPRSRPPLPTRRSASSSASLSAPSRGSSSCWPTWRWPSTPRGS